MSEATDETTRILKQLCDGEMGAADELVPHIYAELRSLAAAAMRNERADHTLQPTALVNEAFLKLIRQQEARWEGKSHFCAAAARTMRNILIDHARKRDAEKRGGLEWRRIPLEEEFAGTTRQSDIDLLDLDRLLVELEELNPRHARVIELRFFTGLSIEETAVALKVSDWTIKNDWRVARAWLLSRLDDHSHETYVQSSS